MKKFKQITGLIAITLLTLTSCTQQVAIDVSDEIKARNEQLVKATLNKDFEAVGEIYSENAVLMGANSDVVVGRENAVNLYKGMMDMGITDAKIETVEAKSYGNIAVEEGRYEMYVGDQKVDYGKYIVIWEKVDGVWKISKDIMNTSVPLPPPPPPADETVTE